MTKLLDGKQTAAEIRAEVAEGARDLAARTGVVPGLAVVLVGDDAASAIYVRNKAKAAETAGMTSRVLRLDASTSEAEVLRTVAGLNADPAVHGILVQLPLPQGVSEQRVTEAIDPRKDVDGFHPVNAGHLLAGTPGFVPCTPAGIIQLLERRGIPLEGRHAVVVGRSNIVGKPMAVLLLRKHCTVTICHSRTPDLARITALGEILVAAVGKAALIGAEHIRPGAVVVDVGIHRLADEAAVRHCFGDDPERLGDLERTGATLVGDVHPLAARERAGWITPVPGGVGPLTVALLLSNTLDAARALAS